MKPKHRSLLRTTDESVKTGDAWWSFFKAVWEDGKPYLLALVSGATVIGGATQNVFQWISQYGWAGWVLAGVAGLVSVCLLTFLISAVWYFSLIVRDRHRNRVILPTRSPGEAVAEDHTAIPVQIQALKRTQDELVKAWASSNQANDKNLESVRSVIAGLSSRLEKMEASLRPKVEGILAGGSTQTFATRLDAIEAKIQAARDYVEGALTALGESLKQHKTYQNQLFNMVVGSLRARDAEAKFREADAVVMALGAKLISADSYKNGAAWSRDRNEWGYTLKKIDDLLTMWEKDYHQLFLRVEHYEYERESRKAPAHIVDEEENTRRYKHVCISHDKYLNKRDYLLRYFESKAHDLPG